VRQTARTSGIHGLALTKLDILDGFDEIRSVSATSSTARRSTICRRARAPRHASSRSMKPLKAGRSRLPMRGHGPIFPRRRSSMSAASRNLSAARLLCSPPALNARIRSSCRIRLRLESEHGTVD
jgi:hypothetical protein